MPKILDACCGSRLFWFDKDCSFATYMDIREEEYEIHGKKINVKPDVVADFRDMPFENNVYDLVVFDPPHLKWAGQNSIMKGQYGQLDKENWPEDIKQGMSECMRVLKPSGTLIFKWNENQVKLKDVLKAVEPYSPLFGNKRSQTHWLVFMKEEQQKPVLPEFVAKWFEDAKDNLEIPIFYECVRAMEICKEYRNEFHQWFANSKKKYNRNTHSHERWLRGRERADVLCDIE